ncbi:MAG TPA: HAD-IIIA family hydrolase [Candidatus Saccharimonadales bacterium]|nr:HAD-IIIA family hydrolase [Candidatus Saccharimonadales bacterium]
MPRYELVQSAGDVPYDDWAGRGVKAVLFDKDGTLTHANQPTMIDGVLESLQQQELNRLFSHIGISSNNPDTRAVNTLASLLEDRLDIGVLALSSAAYRRKPHPEMGLAAAEQLGVSPNELGIVGDRRLTDVSFGLRVGAGAIALCEKGGDGDALFVPTLRRVEKVFVRAEQAMRRVA